MLLLSGVYLKSVSRLFSRTLSTVNSQKNDLNDKYRKIGFIGSGNMARAIIAGLIGKNKFKPEEIYVTDSDLEYVEYLKTNVQLFKVRNF
jgi:hypothetical protein